MFEFYRDCTFLTEENSSFLSVVIDLTPIIIAFVALVVAYFNFKAFRDTNSVQTHLDLIGLENDLRKKYANLKTITKEYNAATTNITSAQFNSKEIERLTTERTNAFELYVSSVDKLASLINAEYLKNQFGKRDWKEEYQEIFQEAKTRIDTEKSIIPGKDGMVRNLEETLTKWRLN